MKIGELEEKLMAASRGSKKKIAAASPTRSTEALPSTPKKKTRRSQSKYPALDPALNLKTRTDLIVVDYIHKLNDEEKQWLNKFNEEYVNCSFDRKNLKKNLAAKNKKLKKDCDDRNNARNRCILTRQKATGFIEYLEEHSETLGSNPEQYLNTKMDLENNNYIDKEGNVIMTEKERLTEKTSK